MMRISVLALTSFAAMSPIYASGQGAPGASTPAPAPASVTSSPALPSTATVAQTPGITLRSLPSVLDVRERREDWHRAADQAGNRIQDLALKSQFNQRMAGVVPAVAKLLMSHPQEYALVTVGVYRGKDAPDKQAMVAVTLDGLDSQLGSDFFADVVAGLPQIPSGEGIPSGLSLDVEATSYLVFFLGEKQLEAGDISHSTFGKSIMLATNRVQKDQEAQAVATAANAERARANVAAAQAAQAQANQNANQSNVPNTGTGTGNNGYVEGQAAGYVAPANPYGYGYNYPLINDGYYYPGVGVPLVIVPGEVQTTPENLKRQGDRERRLEREYQQRSATKTNLSGVRQTPAMGTGTNSVNGGTVQGGTRSPATGSQAAPTGGVKAVPGTGTSPTAGTPTQGKNSPVTFPQPGQPGGAPAGSPATPPGPVETSGPNGSSPSGVPHPAPGTPGGAPAPKK